MTNDPRNIQHHAQAPAQYQPAQYAPQPVAYAPQGYAPQPAGPINLEAFGDNSHLLALAEGDATANVFGDESGPRVSIRGKVFRLMQGATEVMANPYAMDFVIVAAAEHVARTYYAGAWNEDVHERPTCSSQNGVVPTRGVSLPQSTNCAQCPQNQEGSGKEGKGRACRFSQSIAVCLPGDWDNVYSMRIPAKSLFGSNPQTGQYGLQAYTRFIRAKRYTPAMFVTRFDWNHNEQLALLFSPSRALSAEEYRTVLSIQNRPDVLRAINTTDADDMAEPVNMTALAAPAYQQPAPQPAPVYPQPTTAYQQPAPIYPAPVQPRPAYQQPAPLYPAPPAPPAYQQPAPQPTYQPPAPQDTMAGVVTRPRKGAKAVAEPEVPLPVIRSNAPQEPVIAQDLEALVNEWAQDES
jgi:hypothetical protein